MKFAVLSLIAVTLALPLSVRAADQPARAPAPAARVAAAKEAPRAADRAVDRLQLDSTSITGNRELPKVMSIVPWKQAEPPGGPDRPMNSLIEEVLAPVDRDEFQREVTYFRDLSSPRSPAQPKSSPGVPQP